MDCFNCHLTTLSYQGTKKREEREKKTCHYLNSSNVKWLGKVGKALIKANLIEKNQNSTIISCRGSILLHWRKRLSFQGDFFTNFLKYQNAIESSSNVSFK